MKSFKHFYQYVKLTAFDSSQTDYRKIDAIGLAPAEMPDHVARFLLKRLAHRWIRKWKDVYTQDWLRERP